MSDESEGEWLCSNCANHMQKEDQKFVFSGVPYCSSNCVKFQEQQKTSLSLTKTVKEYGKHRLASDFESIFKLCSENITIESERDGKFVGKEQVLNYFEKVSPQGSWQEPRALSSTCVAVQGTVSVLFINVSVVAYYEFDSSGKIKKVQIKRGVL